MLHSRLLLAFACFSVSLLCFVPRTSAEPPEGPSGKVKIDRNGQRTFVPLPMAKELTNAWPQEWEQAFQRRAAHIIDAQTALPAKGTTYFESEKRLYGFLMAHIMGGDIEHGLKGLQGEDAQAKDWHRHTEGIDYFACFTLKHQMRKYFYFGDMLDDDYRKRMYRGAKLWTAVDPLRRPHHSYESATGWGPNAKNSWVDVRSTENLFLMRVTSVYLMAEETGNRKTTEQYKELILDYTKSLYRIGIGEWDSENYHGHSITPLCNLYDFAKDPQVKAAAKACLDWYMIAGAVKYSHGAFNGPGSRDYNHAQPFGGSAPNMLWVYFGDSPRDRAGWKQTEHWESDEVHAITSAYRPPPAVVHLARKDFDKPVEILASKPSYSATTGLQADSKPEFLETHYIGNHFQMGSLACGTPPGVSSINGFKILANQKEFGAQAIHVAPGSDPAFAGSPLYVDGKIKATNRVAQYGNTATWIAKDGDSPWIWVVPDTTKVSQQGDWTVFAIDNTWVAAHPVGCSNIKQDKKRTSELLDNRKNRFPDHSVYSCQGNQKNFCGLIIQVGEPQSHGSLSKFTQALGKTELDTSKLEQGIVQVRYADGKFHGFHWNDNANDLGNWQNGKRHDWQRHATLLYGSLEDGKTTSPVKANWGSGTIDVCAGGKHFRCHVDEEGNVEFVNENL